jgi:hypothetical protein
MLLDQREQIFGPLFAFCQEEEIQRGLPKVFLFD